MGRAYGGHVYAQAAWAAAQTVPKGFVIHVSCLRISRIRGDATDCGDPWDVLRDQKVYNFQ